MNKNLPYYLLALSLFGLLKLWLGTFDNQELYFLLKPTDAIFSLVSGSKSVFTAQNGFFHERYQMVIEKSCSGYNFMLICFLMLYFLIIKFVKSRAFKVVWLLGALGISYVVTVFINSSRILVSVSLQDSIENLLHLDAALTHQSIGVLTNLTFLIIIYLLVEKIIIKKYAQLTSS